MAREADGTRARELAAAQLNDALIEIGKFTPQLQMRPEDAAEPLARAIGQLHEARVRTAVIVEPEITARLAALDSALFIASQDARDLRKPTVNFCPLTVAFQDVHNALVAFRRREELPDRMFPPAHELSALAFPEGRMEGLEGVMSHLIGAKGGLG